jgi:hypothetical protein
MYVMRLNCSGKAAPFILVLTLNEVDVTTICKNRCYLKIRYELLGGKVEQFSTDPSIRTFQCRLLLQSSVLVRNYFANIHSYQDLIKSVNFLYTV